MGPTSAAIESFIGQLSTSWPIFTTRGEGGRVTQPSRTFLEFHHARRRTFETPSVGGPGNSRRFGPGPEQLRLRLFIAARPPNSSPVGVEVKERKEADTHCRRELRTRLNIAVTSRRKKDIHREREKKQRRDCDSHRYV